MQVLVSTAQASLRSVDTIDTKGARGAMREPLSGPQCFRRGMDSPEVSCVSRPARGAASEPALVPGPVERP